MKVETLWLLEDQRWWARVDGNNGRVAATFYGLTREGAETEAHKYIASMDAARIAECAAPRKPINQAQRAEGMRNRRPRWTAEDYPTLD